MVENKELIFFLNAHQKSAIIRNDLILRVCSFKIFCFTQKLKNCGKRSLKCCSFENLGSRRLLREFLGYFSSNIDTSWHG
jgi:hypothetical protein